MIPVPQQKLDKLITNMRHYNIYPVFLDDVEYQYGSNHPLCDQFNEIVSELNEYLLIATDDELKATYDALDSYYRIQIKPDLLLVRDELMLKNVAIFLVISLTQHSYNDVKRYIKTDYRKQSEVLRTFPEIANYEDDEGLLPLGKPEFVPAGVGGGIYYKDHLLFYHQFLRSSFSSDLNASFLNALVEYHKKHRDQRVAVAIDHLRLMSKEWFRQTFGKARSFGPPLALKSLDDPLAIGLTVYEPDEPRLIPLVGFERTEFYWSIKHNDTKKAFEVEEVYSPKQISKVDDELVLARYVHTLRNIEAHAFTHLDGAVKIYRRNQYEQRNKTKMPNELKAMKKIKVFRIDADAGKGEAISNDEWSRLIGFFFQENTMVAEYLNPNFATVG
jgi:hypothetical protein